MRHSLPIVLSIVLGAACASETVRPKVPEPSIGEPGVAVLTAAEAAKTRTDFRSYWHGGQAELSRFRLEQSRYGELHEGEAVLIFVTEDFLRDKQVKYEFGDKSNAVPILKLNAYRRFYTGVYPYNILTSTFTPTADEPTLKVSSSTQEWCGMAFTQLNRAAAEPTGAEPSVPSGFDVASFSYFQQEGDQKFALPHALLEDEVWTLIRKDPALLPTGSIEAIPAVHYARLMHKELKPYAAKASLSDAPPREGSKTPLKHYTLEFPTLKRSVEIRFEAQFPYQVVSFKDSAPALFNPKSGEPAMLTTRGTLTHAIMLDYWSKHGTADAAYRKALGLTF